MSLVLPLALSLVQQHLAAAASAERDRLESLRASFDAYVTAREECVVTTKLHAWGVVSDDVAERATSSVRSALDALLTCLDTELPRNSETRSASAPADSGVRSIEPSVVRAERPEMRPAPEAEGKSGPTFSIPASQTPPSTPVEEPPFPTLLAEPRVIAMFGGEVRPEKVKLAGRLLGRSIVWFSNRQAHQLERSLKRGRVAAVVILQGLTGHVACDYVRAICRQRGIATAFGDRAGTEDLRRAFGELESKLGGVPSAA